MKAAVIEKLGELVVREVPEPVMGEHDALCEILYGATCSGTDCHLIDGHNMPFPYEFPTMLGHESIGRVVEVGSKVENFKVGDLVTRVINRPAEGLDSNWGGFAERGLVTDLGAQEGDKGAMFSGVHHVLAPDTNPAAATMIITWRETFSFISRIGLPVAARVLVVGSGANGLAFVNHAANMMAAQVVMVGNKNRQAVADRVGATDYVPYDSGDTVEEMKQKGLGDIDLIIDAVGRKGILNNVMPLLKTGGIVTTYGVDEYGQIQIDPGRAQGSFTYAQYDYNEGEAHNMVMKLVQRGLLRAEHYCDLNHIYPLEQINAAFAAVRRREAVKAVVAIGNEKREHLS